MTEWYVKLTGVGLVTGSNETRVDGAGGHREEAFNPEYLAVRYIFPQVCEIECR